MPAVVIVAVALLAGFGIKCRPLPRCRACRHKFPSRAARAYHERVAHQFR